jgi:hypothetical protein
LYVATLVERWGGMVISSKVGTGVFSGFSLILTVAAIVSLWPNKA